MLTTTRTRYRLYRLCGFSLMSAFANVVLTRA